jgi:hypothetical protein
MAAGIAQPIADNFAAERTQSDEEQAMRNGESGDSGGNSCWRWRKKAGATSAETRKVMRDSWGRVAAAGGWTLGAAARCVVACDREGARACFLIALDALAEGATGLEGPCERCEAMRVTGDAVPAAHDSGAA